MMKFYRIGNQFFMMRHYRKNYCEALMQVAGALAVMLFIFIILHLL